MTFFARCPRDCRSSRGESIFVTGDVAGTEAERFLEESGCRWLPKPFRLRISCGSRETLG